MIPVIAPSMQAKPAARPWASARPTNSVMSGPGVIAMMKVAIANCTIVALSGTNSSIGYQAPPPFQF